MEAKTQSVIVASFFFTKGVMRSRNEAPDVSSISLQYVFVMVF
ncbi:hypothetical protein A464_2408 [Salmonella bongori N268-08]|uniref:Uncharacterized protein n=1 Tax=Salmonella bongori N268-08 TaxID=1197719 RepID=S5MY36_SALBN|nr:hypothetical protein A464_2408 [Salmonella bongori N268-08]